MDVLTVRWKWLFLLLLHNFVLRFPYLGAFGAVVIRLLCILSFCLYFPVLLSFLFGFLFSEFIFVFVFEFCLECVFLFSTEYSGQYNLY